MRRLLSIVGGVPICNAVATLALPPPSFAIVPDGWNTDGVGSSVPEVDISMWSDAAVTLTGVELFGGELQAYAPADLTVVPTVVKATLALTGHTSAHLDNTIRAKVAGFAGNGFTLALVQSGSVTGVGVLSNVGKAYTFTFKNGVTTQANLNTAITASADLEVATAGTGATVLATGTDVFSAVALAGGSAELDSTAHGKFTGDGPLLMTDGTMPTGLDGVTPYWLIKDDADTLRVATSLSDALAGNGVDFSTAGVGTCKLVKTATTQRMHWASHGLLGPLGDGAVAMDEQLASWVTRPHRARVIAYALKGTVASGAGTISSSVYPVFDA